MEGWQLSLRLPELSWSNQCRYNESEVLPAAWLEQDDLKPFHATSGQLNCYHQTDHLPYQGIDKTKKYSCYQNRKAKISLLYIIAFNHRRLITRAAGTSSAGFKLPGLILSTETVSPGDSKEHLLSVAVFSLFLGFMLWWAIFLAVYCLFVFSFWTANKE